MDNCTACGTSFVGEEIPKEQQELFGATHWRLEIGIEYPEKYDGVWEWRCPECKFTWPSEVAKLKEY